MEDEMMEVLTRIERSMSALLAISVDRYLRETELAKPRPRSIDRMLVDAGLTHAEVAQVLGKSRQAVGQVLAKDGNPRKKPPRSASQDGVSQDGAASPTAAAETKDR